MRFGPVVGAPLNSAGMVRPSTHARSTIRIGGPTSKTSSPGSTSPRTPELRSPRRQQLFPCSPAHGASRAHRAHSSACSVKRTMTQKLGYGRRGTRACYRFDVPVGGGQSGAPLMVIGADNWLYLPSLVFCGNDCHTDATPLYQGKVSSRNFTAALHSAQ